MGEALEDHASAPTKTKASTTKREKPRKRKQQLFKNIREQMEFYFSDANLRKDRFMTELVQENDEGYVDLEVFLTFHKIQSFTNDVKVIASALESSEFLKLSEDRSRVKRTTRLEYKPNVDECTLYVERLPMNADHAWLKTTFSKHGQVLYVSLPRYRHNNKMKGFAFVEFSTPEELEKACQHFGYQGTNKEVEGGGMADDEGTAPNIAMKHPRQAEENEAPSAKRQKLNEEEEDKSEVELKVAKMEEEVPESTEETEAESSATKRSKKRKRKKRLQKAKEQQPLLVMPKCEWKRLRNKYLALQKATMAQIKRSLLPCQPPVYSPGRSPGARSPAFLAAQSEGAAEPEVRNQKVAPATLEFQPNVIVKLSTEKPVSNATEFKNNIRHLANVAYVDVVEGECAAYVRCADAESARKFVDTEKESFCGSLSLLSGEEERMYWEKINQDRETRRSLKTRQKKRGVEKAMNITSSGDTVPTIASSLQQQLESWSSLINKLDNANSVTLFNYLKPLYYGTARVDEETCSDTAYPVTEKHAALSRVQS